ncbi:tripartite tricarboxylate transporter TctB family protein [Microvirga sp. 2YAF29]|uniref:tripartite tricarboxylate transporter TctB family protein n=1 Tax=Microvirga sp. 2YAF29 TaxID=3233031 RepID=UPI003F9D14D3
MKRFQLIAAAVLGAVALVIILGTAGLEFWSGISPGPRFMPILVGTAILVLSALYMYEVNQHATDAAIDFPTGSDGRRIIFIALAIIAFALIAVPLGIIVAAFVFILVTLLLILRQPLLPSLLASIVTIGVIYSIFVAWLDLRLPVGIFGI